MLKQLGTRVTRNDHSGTIMRAYPEPVGVDSTVEAEMVTSLEGLL